MKSKDPADEPVPTTGLTMIGKARRVLVALMGGTVLALGIAFLVLPGPAFLVIPAGLAILAVEFAWARRWLRNIRQFLQRKHPLPDEIAEGSQYPGRVLPHSPKT